MKPKLEKLELIKQMIETAEGSLSSAKSLLMEVGGSAIKTSYVKVARDEGRVSEGGKIIEGVFNGEFMLGPDGKDYQVPANYASKSKLIAGDRLKLSISEDGTFIYKQIGPVNRKRLIGTLLSEEGNFKVVAEGRAYKVLYASVTYFKASVGNRVTIIIPEDLDTDWAAIENVLPDITAAEEGDAVPQIQTESV